MSKNNSKSNLIWGDLDIEVSKLPGNIIPIHTVSGDNILLNKDTYNQITLTSSGSSIEAFGEIHLSYKYYLNGSLISFKDAKSLVENLYK